MNAILQIGQLILCSLLFVVVTVPLLVLPIFAGMSIHLGKSRNQAGFYGLAVLFGTMTILFVLLNPITGTLLGAIIEDHKLTQQKAMYVGQTPEIVLKGLGQPDHIYTNDGALYLSYRSTSPWFSWCKSDTVVNVESNKVKWIVLDD